MNKFELNGFAITTDNNGSDQQNMFSVNFSGNLELAMESSNPDEIHKCVMELFIILFSIEFERDQEEEFAAMYGFFGTDEYDPDRSMEEYLTQMESNPEWSSQVKRFRFLEKLEKQTDDLITELIKITLKHNHNHFESLKQSEHEELINQERHALKLKFDKECDELVNALSS